MIEPADEDFWTRVRTALASRQTLLLEETYVCNAARWHRLTQENLDTVGAGLGPRALLTVWPDLTPDVGAVLAALPEEGSVEFVWEAQDGMISSAIVDDTEYHELTTQVTDARAACVLPLSLDERHPLLCAVLRDRKCLWPPRMRVFEGPVPATAGGTSQVKKRIGSYPRVRVEGGGRSVVSQAGGVLRNTGCGCHDENK